MTVQTISTNAPLRETERAPSSDASTSERRPLSQYILAERSADEEREGGDDFGWTIFDSETDCGYENKKECENSTGLGRDLSVLKRIKRFLNDGANDGDGEGGAICDACANEEKKSSERSGEASFFDDEVAAPVRDRVAYPFYDGAQSSAKNVASRREPSLAVGCVADSELIFESKINWNGAKRRAQRKENVGAEGENIENVKNGSIHENAENAKNEPMCENVENAKNESIRENVENAVKGATLEKIEKTSSTSTCEDFSKNEITEAATNDETAELASISEIEKTTKIGTSGKVAKIAETEKIEENVASQTFAVDFSEMVESVSARRPAEEKSQVATEETAANEFSKRLKNIKKRKIRKIGTDVGGDANGEETRETSTQTMLNSETSTVAEASTDRVNPSVFPVATSEIRADVGSTPNVEKVQIFGEIIVGETKIADETASCVESASRVEMDDCGGAENRVETAIRANDENAPNRVVEMRTASLEETLGFVKKIEIAKKNGGELRWGDERFRAANEGTTIFQRFVQLVASSERKSRDCGGATALEAEIRTRERRRSARFDELEAELKTKRFGATRDFASPNGDREDSTQNAERDAFGEVVSLVVAPTFADFNATCPAFATAAFSTFDALGTSAERGDGGDLGSL